MITKSAMQLLVVNKRASMESLIDSAQLSVVLFKKKRINIELGLIIRLNVYINRKRKFMEEFGIYFLVIVIIRLFVKLTLSG